MSATLILGPLVVAVLQAAPQRVMLLPSPPRRPLAEWRVQDKPELLINSETAGPQGEFNRIMGLVRLSSGRIAVANSGSSEIRFFAPNGRFLRAAGRKGSGPGEYQQLFALFAAPGDSVIGYDVVQGFHLFSPDGTFARTLAYGRQSAVPLLAWPYGWFADGSQLAGVLPPTSARASGRWVDSMVFMRVDPSGEHRNELFRAPAMERSVTWGGRPGLVVFGPNLGVAVWSHRYCVGFSGTFEFRCGSIDGGTWKLRREVTRSATVPAAVIERYKRELLDLPMEGGGPPPPQIRTQREALVKSLAYADRQPHFGQVLAAHGGDLWIQRYVLELGMPSFAESSGYLPRPSLWDVFGESGSWKATLILPARFKPFQAGGDYVLGVLLDEDDVEQVAMFGLIKPPSAKR